MDELIKLFQEVRDIPYHCPEDLEDSDYRCWGKNRVLFNKLREKGYEVRFRVCEFKWNEQRLPPKITSKAPKKDDKHLFLELRLGDKWRLVDASNDSGLPSYNNFDGKTDCELAVKPLKIYSPRTSALLEQKEKEEFKDYFEENKEFYKEINRFMESIRR